MLPVLQIWIHDKDNASAHANMVSQYFQYAGATYTFRTKRDITPGTVIRLKEDLYSGLDVYVLITAREFPVGSEVWKYTAVGVSTFDLTESAYHGTTEPAKQSGAQGPAGEPGESSEVQYAIGTSLTDPPGDAMMWGGVDMLWASATMNWNTGTWEETVPTEERGKYIWMRIRIGDGPWQYTRLTGSASYDPTFLGAVTSLPIQTPDGLDLIPGDYFVAAEDFGVYSEGFAYVYNGSTWDVMDLEDVDNAPKALQCLGGILASGAHVTNATYSIWGWFQNFVAQNAVIQNLFAQAIQILNGGCIHSDFYNADGTQKTEADIDQTGSGYSATFWSKSLFLESCHNIIGTYKWVADDSNPIVWDPTDGNPLGAKSSNAMQDYGITINGTPVHYDTITVTVFADSDASSGFWLGANGVFKCHSAEARNLSITGDSFFQGTFDCDVIKTVSVDPTVTGTYSASSGNGQAKTLVEAFPASVRPDYPRAIAGVPDNISDYLPVQMTTPLGTSSDIVYVRLRRSYQSGADSYYDFVEFYDASRNQLDVKNYFTCSGSAKALVSRTYHGSIASGTYANTTVTIKTIIGGNVLELNIPSQGQASNLSSGQLYYDTSGYVRIKL